MTQSRPPEDNALDAAFSAMRDATPAVPDDLLRRVKADAMAEMQQAACEPMWKQVTDAIGGWPAMAGLAATACVGLWVGGVLTDDLITTFGFADSASLEIGEKSGAFDHLLVDG